MTVVWKHHLGDLPAPQTIRVPKGAELLNVQLQWGRPCVWFRCNPDAPLEHRTINAVMTGNTEGHEPVGRYLGTVLLANGAYVLHYFEE